jgi:CBS domain-containing protein
MTRLRDIMTREVVSVPPDVSIRDAMSLLSSRHISGVPVVVGRDIVGVITSTDLMAFAAELSSAPGERDDQVPLEELPASDGRHRDIELEPFGRFFTGLWEDADADVTARFANVGDPLLDALDTHTVDEAMTRRPIYSVSADSTLPVAAEFMRSHGIHRVFVTEKGKFVGIVTSTDIANAVAGHKLRGPQYVFGKEAHFTGTPTGKPAHPETTLGARLARKEGIGKPPRRPNRRGK